MKLWWALQESPQNHLKSNVTCHGVTRIIWLSWCHNMEPLAKSWRFGKKDCTVAFGAFLCQKKYETMNLAA